MTTAVTWTLAPPSAPNWAPLELAALDQCPYFMHMCRLTGTDGRTVEQYKHIDTRRYLNLDDSGRAYRVTVTGGPDGMTVEPIEFADALAYALS